MGIHCNVHLESASTAMLTLAFSSRLSVRCTNFDMASVVLNRVLQFCTSQNSWLKKNIRVFFFEKVRKIC